ncbi:hypothetical protein JK635_01925 [Neobacillus sp. YIM B02564]|uniref:Uncharacterized protein n=1 Tax=Neobacillus paridis TaxID=2803862 RepID=A0ABS1TIA7_9BACI|nr:hypothetical protein [Neobacillus paridis]MBL4950997.1 hypothetical protein [Neobacillus paridis]
MSKKVERKTCLECGKEQRATEFYKHDAPIYQDKKYPICKTCIKSKLKLDDPMSSIAIESVKDVMLQMNKPFILELWISSIDEAKKTGKKDIFGLYKKNVDQNNADGTWKDSIFEIQEIRENNVKETINTSKNLKVELTDDLINKWGYGYSNEEYLAFERKYNMLKNNYQEKTAMHTEALLTYIRYRVKEEMSTAMNDMKSAKEWGQLAQKAAKDAKINPSQLSKSDLSDGLDTFGQLTRTVEQAVDIIPILPQFKERPQDKVDFTIWCYINYIRDLKGLPLAEYEDIYRFYEERKKEYEEREEIN